MTGAPTSQPTPRPSLRLWPGVVAVALLLVRYLLPVVIPSAAGTALIFGLVGTLMVIVWWLFFSRARWSERLGVIAFIALAMAATSRVIHVSIAGGMMGMMFPVYAIQSLGLALVVWAVATRRLPEARRRAWLVVAVLMGCGLWTLLRTDGMQAGGAQLAWRWTPTAEERLLALGPSVPVPATTQTPAVPPVAGSGTETAALPPTPATASDAAALATPALAQATSGAARITSSVSTSGPGTSGSAVVRPTGPGHELQPGEGRVEWPGFRGPARDGIVRGVRIATDWTASPPVEIWRRPIGPGWSSFAVHGNRLFTQEQRGDDEVVGCYDLATGTPVWMHRDAARFWESNAGAGPRGTPTLGHGRVYAFGATGILNALDEATGRVVWSRNAATDTGRPVPDWGFSSSPLVIDDLVIVATAGTLAGYDAATGKPRWIGPVRGGGYSSPHRVTIDGVTQVVLLSGTGATSLAPADGAVLWEHAWPGGAIVQPALAADGDLLINAIGMTGGVGLRRLGVARKPDGWSTAERWTSSGLKPYFNDFVVHKGHAYGFDGSILSSIDLVDGRRTWKGGRYGDGQLVLLADQDLLLVLSEEGGLALVSATPDKFTELARFKAIDGKTWNHPVLVGDVLLVRNGEEMAAFRLPRASR